MQDLQEVPFKQIFLDLQKTIQDIDKRVESEDVTRMINSVADTLEPYRENPVEKFLNGLEQNLASGTVKGWHPFFDSAYAGGSVVIGAGYTFFVSPYNTVEVRGSWTFKNYKRIEAEFRAPSLFDRRGMRWVLGGWREATQVGFWGFGDCLCQRKVILTLPRCCGNTLCSNSRSRRSANLTAWVCASSAGRT